MKKKTTARGEVTARTGGEFEVPSWAMLFDDTGYSDRHLTVLYDDNIKDMKDVKSDDGEKGFGDKTSSAMFCIAVGLTCRLYEDDSYGGKSFDLEGTGQLEKVNIKDQGFNDKTSSLKWILTS